MTGTVQSASAHTTAYPSSLPLAIGSNGSSEEPVWWGQVTSAKPSCQPNRKVKLFRDTAKTGSHTLIGLDETDDEGYWQITVTGYPPPDGTYYAKARPQMLRKNAKHRHTCGKARSDELVVPGPDIDYDGDGYFVVQGDCDDDNAAVNPGATEVGNGIDDDCDGTVDEGCIPGQDGTNPCDLDQDGYTPGDGDCNDANPAVHPNATEVDNDVDDDCDGTVDEGFDAVDQDSDSVSDQSDNCSAVANPTQEDADLDGKGDACDACPQVPNPGAEPCPIEKTSVLRADRRS